MPHPQLWPALIGAVLGLAVLLWAGWHLFKHWRWYSARKRWIVGVPLALFAAAYGLNVYAWLIEPNMLVVRRVAIASQDWRGAPLTIAAVSDTHVGSPHVSVARMIDLVEILNGLDPDLVVLLGDYAGHHEPEAGRSPSGQREI